ncbi:MAG: type II and III secretion system protein [Chitinivorax sp.]
MTSKITLIAAALGAALAGCATHPVEPSASHIGKPAARTGSIPGTVAALPALPPPKPGTRPETFSVVVNDVPVRELLFALARDAKVNIDVHPAIEGLVTLNAINQTLPQILDRVAAQVDLRYELKDRALQILPDEPYLKTYKIDYVNMSRFVSGQVSIATTISTAGGTVQSAAGQGVSGQGGDCLSDSPGKNLSGDGAGGGTTSQSSANSSSTCVKNYAENRFWDRIVLNLNQILLEKDKLVVRSVVQGSDEQKKTQVAGQAAVAQGQGSIAAASGGLLKLKGMVAGGAVAAGGSGDQQVKTSSVVDAGQSSDQQRTLSVGKEAANVIAHPESGVVMVRATARQHKKVQEFLSEVLASAQRQVLIEASIVEVELSDQFQSGVDWSRIADSTRSYTSFSQSLLGSNLSAAPFTQLTFNIANPSLFSGTFSSTVKLLESFGKTKVISSPKIMALNNQTSLLKVVQEKVYFTVDIDITEASVNGPGSRTYTSNLHTVPVGMVMSVTPQISDSNLVSLNIRPTISNIIGYKADPVPKLINGGFDNLVPELEVREIESTLKLSSGQVAVLGGLIRDRVENVRQGLPWFSRLPLIGTLTSHRDETVAKSELVIFLRPVVVNDPSVNGDLASFRDHLPDKGFFNRRDDEIAPHYLDGGRQ